MSEHPNVARIRRGYEIRGTSTEFGDSDRAEIEDLFHEDLVYHGQGTSKFAQDFRGRDEFFAVERQFARTATMRQEVKRIFADDVQCGHGATSGDLDEDLLFYLRARGIPAKDAEALLIQAFVGEAVEGIEHAGLRDALMDQVVAWLAART